jgi:hypothetical protein
VDYALAAQGETSALQRAFHLVRKEQAEAVGAALVPNNAFLQQLQAIGVWGAMEPKTNVSSESHRKGAFRSPAHPPGITL